MWRSENAQNLRGRAQAHGRERARKGVAELTIRAGAQSSAAQMFIVQWALFAREGLPYMVVHVLEGRKSAPRPHPSGQSHPREPRRLPSG